MSVLPLSAWWASLLLVLIKHTQKKTVYLHHEGLQTIRGRQQQSPRTVRHAHLLPSFKAGFTKNSRNWLLNIHHFISIEEFQYLSLLTCSRGGGPTLWAPCMHSFRVPVSRGLPGQTQSWGHLWGCGASSSRLCLQLDSKWCSWRVSQAQNWPHSALTPPRKEPARQNAGTRTVFLPL